MRSHAHPGTRTTIVSIVVTVVVVAGFAGALAPLPASTDAGAPPSDGGMERAILDLTGYADETILVLPAHLPAPSSSSGIGPGRHLLITMTGETGLFACTSNFVWTDAGGAKYLGAAGHCFLPETKTATHGTGNDYDPAGTTVRICISACMFGGQAGFEIQGNTVLLGPVVYARQKQGAADVGNDFGLVSIPTDLVAFIDPSLPVWGGPTGLPATTLPAGTPVCVYGHAAGFGEVFATQARSGVGVSMSPGAGFWNADLPSFKGDSGAAVVKCSNDASGVHGTAAVGILTHIVVGPLGVITGTTVQKAKAMALQDAGLDVNMLLGA